MANTDWSDLRKDIVRGKAITDLEALMIYGVATLRHLVAEMRKDGWEINQEKVELNKVIQRINTKATCIPPDKLDTTNLMISEYRIKK